MAFVIPYGLAAPAVIAPAATGLSAEQQAALEDPLGCGIIRPFRRVPRGDFANDCGELLVRSDLGQLLGIILGELPWRTTLGTLIYQLRHRANTGALSELARVQIEEAIRQWEPRVRLLAVSADPIRVGTENRILLRIRYRIGQSQPREDTAVL